MILFPHGSGISPGPGDGLVARRLRDAGLGTFLLDLLTEPERNLDARVACFRFDSGLLTERLAGVNQWLSEQPATRGLPVGCFGTGTVASAVLAAGQRTGAVEAIVLYDAQPDQAAQPLTRPTAPTLFLVDGTDEPLFNLTYRLRKQLGDGIKRLVFVAGSRQFLHESGAVEEVSQLAVGWFSSHLKLAPLSALPQVGGTP